VIIVLDMPINQRKKRVVSSNTNIASRIDLGPMLPYDDVSCLRKLAAEYLDTKPLASAVSSVS
jgi:hypothetical protein